MEKTIILKAMEKNLMFHRKLNDRTKKTLEKTADTTITVTRHFIIWVFLILAVSITGITLVSYISSGVDISTITSLGIGGFWAFFGGYFGWRLAEELETYFKWRKK